MLAFYLSLLETKEEQNKMTILYQDHKKAMLFEAKCILGCFGRAEDAVHDVFIKLTRNLDAVDEKDLRRSRAYLCQAVRRVAYDMRRADRRCRVVSMEAVEEIPEEEVDFLGGVAREELLGFIKALPEIYQEVLELKAYHALSDKEIAVELGISGPAARKRLERARCELLRIMKRRGVEYAKDRV